MIAAANAAALAAQQEAAAEAGSPGSEDIQEVDVDEPGSIEEATPLRSSRPSRRTVLPVRVIVHMQDIL